MTPYVIPPDIPEGMTLQAYRAARPRKPSALTVALTALHGIAAVRALQFYYRNPRG